MHLPRVAVALALLLATACSPGLIGDSDRPVIGFILVGDRDDLGYNQAIWEGADSVARAFPDYDVRRLENVEEDTPTAVAALESLIDQGARLLFATSFGHLEAARVVAERHPDVVVVHQGGVEGSPDLANLGTYWGTTHEAMYLSGVLAGATERSGDFGFIAAFPIPATFANINAFALGVHTSNEDATIEVVFTDDWCDPDAQARAYDDLVAGGVVAVAFHQDCTRAIIEAAAADDVGVVGYHWDASDVAGEAWLIGAVWDWRDVYRDIAAAATEGAFVGSGFDRDWRGTITAGDSPMLVTEPGPAAVRTAITRLQRETQRLAGGGQVFRGPLLDADGVERVPPDEALSLTQIEALDWFVAGVRMFAG